MQLEGSCHCRAVRFSIRSHHPVPFNRCYCSICRKTQGGGGYAINLSGVAPSLSVTGEEHISVYQVEVEVDEGDGGGDDANRGKSPVERRFCSRCGSGLWCWDPRWPELIHPFASAVDTELPSAPENVHLMLDSKPNWVPVDKGPYDKCFGEYPVESIAAWHQRLGLTMD